MITYKRVIFTVLILSMLAACGPAVSETQVQTAIAEAVLTL